MSLSNCVKEIFGKPLDKRHRISNWERISLTSEQIKYAAMDAHILLDLYDHLVEKEPEMI